jgi:endonuclease YncB( thermonuclease family)
MLSINRLLHQENIVVLTIMLLSICLSLSCQFSGTSTSSGKPAFDAPNKTDLVAVFVSGVINGDTIEVRIDNTIHVVKYIGIDAPKIEMNDSEPEPYSLQAWIANQELVDQKTVYLEQDASNMNANGHLLRYVWTANGTLVNASMVSLGLSYANSNPPNLKYSAGLQLLQIHAKDTGQGLWKPLATQSAVANQNR